MAESMPIVCTLSADDLGDREGAWLKPLCGGERVDLRRVDRMEVIVLRKGPGPVRWRMTPFTASGTEPDRLSQRYLANGPLLDALGQSTLRTWPAP